MHDIRLIREDPEAFDAALARRRHKPMAEAILQIDRQRRMCIADAEKLSAERKTISKNAGAAKKRGDDKTFARLSGQVSLMKNQIASAESEAKMWERKLADELLEIPNLPLDSVPYGTNEANNVELRSWGSLRDFDFAPKEHYELGEAMGAMDFELAAKLSGSRFMTLSGALARLHRALAQFMLDTQVNVNGLTEVWTPVLVRDEALVGTGQLPKFAEDLFVTRRRREPADVEAAKSGWIERFERGERDIGSMYDAMLEEIEQAAKLWLIPTAEATLTNIPAGEIVDEGALPLRFTAWTQCFRAEAGAAGKDTRGMLRQHQFEKVEMVSVTRPEDSEAELARMTRCAEDLLERLGIPYRTVVLSTGDMGFAARRTHDIEVWLPGQGAYREISSCSVCGDFQARRMGARFRRAGEKRPEFVHTLNGSGLAVGRTLIAVMENFQEADGGVAIPEAVRPYMGGARRIDPDGSLG